MDGERLGVGRIISMGLWIRVRLDRWLLESLDRQSGAAGGHILTTASRSVLIFASPSLCLIQFLLFYSSFPPALLPFLPWPSSPCLYAFYYSFGHCYDSPRHNVSTASWTQMWSDTRQSIAVYPYLSLVWSTGMSALLLKKESIPFKSSTA